MHEIRLMNVSMDLWGSVQGQSLQITLDPSISLDIEDKSGIDWYVRTIKNIFAQICKTVIIRHLPSWSFLVLDEGLVKLQTLWTKQSKAGTSCIQCVVRFQYGACGKSIKNRNSQTLSKTLLHSKCLGLDSFNLIDRSGNTSKQPHSFFQMLHHPDILKSGRKHKHRHS